MCTIHDLISLFGHHCVNDLTIMGLGQEFFRVMVEGHKSNRPMSRVRAK